MKSATIVFLTSLIFAPAAALAQAPAQAQAPRAGDQGFPPSNQDFAPIPAGFDAARTEIAHGKMEYVEYASKSIGGKRRMAIYTPAGYSASAKYPVIYLLHGRGDDETGWDVKGSAGKILDNLVADGKIVPAIVVMPNGQAIRGTPDQAQQAAIAAMNQANAPVVQAATAARTALTTTALSATADKAELAAKSQALAAAEQASAFARADAFAALQRTPQRLNAEQVTLFRGMPTGQRDAWADFEQDLLTDIIPFVESHYAARTDRLNRALLGLSMGGGQTLNFGLTHQDLFAYVAAFSPAPNAKPIADLVKSAEQTNKDLKLLWISCGDVDTLVGPTDKTILAGLDKVGLKYLWRRGSGGHSWTLWKNDLYTVSQMLFR